MCGIAGVIGKKKYTSNEISEHLKRFKLALAHRGPDDSGEHIGNNSGFCHLRLSIVDVSGGHQPIYNESKTVGIVYNGEVYNYRELRKDLEARGWCFRTNSDTEVILRAYEEFGVDSFGMLNGMFAFCIWDRTKDAVYLTRDPFGIKPLYIYEDCDRLIFSSELKGILAIPGLDLTPDPLGFQDYLTFRYVQAPNTLFKRIRRIEAGAYLKIKGSSAAQFRYWDLSYKEPFPHPSEDDVKEALHEKLTGVVKSQLMGEVPIGVLLSGGIDSSAISYFVHKNGADLTTFNIGFPDVNEFEFSRSVAQKYGLKHIEITTTVEKMIGNLDNYMLALDEPIGDPACMPLYILAEELKKHVTVVLSGEGGDELFGGYNQYRQVLDEKLPYGKRFDAFLRRSWYFIDKTEFLKDKYLPYHEIRYRKYFDEAPLLNGMLAYDMKTWMPENLMMKADKIMMAHSLEGRFPFLDKTLFEFAAALPQQYKISPDGVTKWILKDLMKGVLPDSLVSRPKMGFTVPVAQLVERLKPVIMETFINTRYNYPALVLDTVNLNRFIESYYYEGKKGSELQVWTIFVMLYWFQTAFERYKREGLLLPGKSPAIDPVGYDANIFENLDAYEIRYELSKTFLKGRGIEIGAGANPQRLPEGAECEYFDKRSTEELSELFKVGQDRINKVYPLDIFHERYPEGVDFLIAHNVLEHSCNPIKLLAEWHSYIKEEGVVVLSLPHWKYCPDNLRLVATFEHLLLDYLLDRDDDSFESCEHVFSFVNGWNDYGRCEGRSKQEVAWLTAESARAVIKDLHWHAFDYELAEMLVKAAALISGKTIKIEGAARPDSIETRTLGDIIFVYRLFKSDNQSDISTIKKSLTETLKRLDSFLDNCSGGGR